VRKPLQRPLELDSFNIFELREHARARLPKGVFEYVDRGTEDEVALRNNREAFERVKLLPRVLQDVSVIDQTTILFGRTMSMPLAIGATGAAALLWYDGDLALARAAAAADIPFMISSASTMSIEQIAAVGGRQWFQLYPWENRAHSYALVQKAYDLGCEALVVTADTAALPNREYNARNGFGIPLRLNPRNVADVLGHPRWLAGVLLKYMFTTGLPRQANLPEELRARVTESPQIGANFRCDTLSWDEIRLLRKSWRGIFIIKGILAPADAIRAVAEGVDAVIVSNHGGRNLDSVVASLDALPQVLDAVEDRIPVLFDSGIRRGSDVVKALALGAKAALVGRAPLYGLAIAGQPGVERAMALLRAEIGRVMAFCGCRSIAEITKELIYRRRDA
jgi:isopentenyl diphosphate isomerase/L-lactate dehydrogenase-like FMN-dependent dehydrogenase